MAEEKITQTFYFTDRPTSLYSKYKGLKQLFWNQGAQFQYMSNLW